MAGGLVATGGALSLLGRTGEAEARTVTGICRLCVMRCGIAAEVRGDRLSHVRGDLASKADRAHDPRFPSI